MATSSNDNVLITFVKCFSEDDSESVDLDTLLEIATENGFFLTHKHGNYQEVLAHAHSCLNQSKKRLEGLILIKTILRDCTTEVYAHNALSWIRLCLQVMQSFDACLVKKLAATVCEKILNVSKDFKSLSREITNVIPQVLTTVLENSQQLQWIKEGLSLVNCCIENYSSSCGVYKGKIDALVVEELKNKYPCDEASRCFANLSQCGGGGNMGTKHTEGWGSQCSRALQTLHDILDHLYEGLGTEQTESHAFSEKSILEFCNLPETHPKKCQQLASAFSTVAKCLHYLLSLGFQSVVHIPYLDILHVITRALSVNCKYLKEKPTFERLVLSGFVPHIHTATLLVLKTLIQNSKKNLLPQSKKVCSLLVQQLMWSHSDASFGQRKFYSEVRKATYDCLSLWLQCCGCFIPTMEEEKHLISEIFHDAKPQEDHLKLTETKASGNLDTPPPHKKRKKGGYSDIAQGISSQRKIDSSAGSDLVQSSLQALYWMLMVHGTNLTAKIRQAINEFVLRHSLHIFRESRMQPIPYKDNECRLQLLKCLLAGCVVSHSSVPAPLHCSLAVFKCASLDTSTEVSSYCLEAQRTLEVMIHPRMPCVKPAVVIEAPIVIRSTEVCQDQASEENDISPDGNNDIASSVSSTSASHAKIQSSCKKSVKEMLFKSSSSSGQSQTEETTPAVEFNSVCTKSSSSYYMMVASNQTSFSGVPPGEENCERATSSMESNNTHSCNDSGDSTSDCSLVRSASKNKVKDSTPESSNLSTSDATCNNVGKSELSADVSNSVNGMSNNKALPSISSELSETIREDQMSTTRQELKEDEKLVNTDDLPDEGMEFGVSSSGHDEEVSDMLSTFADVDPDEMLDNGI